MRLVLAPLGLALTLAVQAAPVKSYDWIRRETIRGGYLSAADLGEGLARMKAVGMNLVMPKFGGLQAPPTEDNLKSLRAWGEGAKANGLHLLPVFNFRGGETEKILSERREVTSGGVTMPRTPCPLDESFWERYILGRAVYLAKHATELGLDGCILDPEMYGADHTVFAGVCYCADCLREFGAASGQPTPDLPAAERGKWLKDQGLDKRFEQHFVTRITGFCQRLERECHASNPDFLLGVLLLDYPLLAHRAMALGLGTETHPVLCFSESTYSPGYTRYVDEQQKAFAAMPAQVLFVPGLWQQQFPTENLAEQYYTCATHAAGYWVYTFESLLEDCRKHPGYMLREPAERYWEALKLANAELDAFAASAGTRVSALKVRPFEPPLEILNTGDLKIATLIPAPDSQPTSPGPLSTPRLRYRNPLFILGKAGEPVVVKVTNLQLANYLPRTQWAVVGPDGKQLMEGVVKLRESAEIAFTPERDGVYVVLATSGQNSHTLVVTSGQRGAFMAAKEHPFVVNGVFGRMYVYVPAGVAQFSVFAKAEGQAAGRGGKLTVSGPDGKSAASLAGDLGTVSEMTVQVPPESQGGIWCLAIEDVTNDLRLYVSPNLPPYLSPDPTKVLTQAKAP
jgi:hypothetical protein